MATETRRQESGGESVPRYFIEFMTENARQHAELADKIVAAIVDSDAKFAALTDKIAATNVGVAEIKGELRIIKALALAMTGAALTTTGAALVALSKYVIGW